MSVAGSRFWILPTVTFLVGVLLTALVLELSGSGEADDEAAGPGASQTTSAAPTGGATTARPDATITVPGSCLNVADNTQELLSLVRDAATAASTLDASKLSAIVRQLQDSQAKVQEQATACQSAASAAQTT